VDTFGKHEYKGAPGPHELAQLPVFTIVSMILTSLIVSILGGASIIASPVKRMVSNGAVINRDFPDPGIMRDSFGTWYAYSTSSASGLVPMSKSVDFVTWTPSANVLPNIPWADG
jgi:hypothetical protein